MGMTNSMRPGWGDLPVTEAQLRYIRDMQEMSPYPLAEFKGKTRGEASDYIDKNMPLAHENTWAIEHGY